MELILGDCLDKMANIPDGSVDMVLTDPPYGTVQCAWDTIIPFEPMWAHLKRIIKPNGAIVMTASQPFTTKLISSNMKMFKYEWIWEKSRKTGFQMVKYRPMREHENILIFYKEQPIFNQKLTKLAQPIKSWRKNGKGGKLLNIVKTKPEVEQTHTGYKTTILSFGNEHNGEAHPTQKPVKLMEYLILTYTNSGETVLDFTMGSGTTGVACIETGRDFIGIELDPGYFKIAQDRIKKAQSEPRLDFGGK